MKKSTLFILIILLLCISFFNIFYNLNKTIYEIKSWAFLSDTEKRVKIFGEQYKITLLLDKNTTKKSKILLVSEDKMPYYLTRYNLYPRKVYSATANELTAINEQNKYQYIFTYNAKISINAYKEIASFTSKNGNYGKLYIKK